MFLDYSKIEFDIFGRPERPELMLQTLGGRRIGTIPGVTGLKFNIKLSEPSEISFDVPAMIDGEKNKYYEMSVSHKVIYTKHYGIYVVNNPSSEADGLSDVKRITGYSLEKTLESKKFFIEEGTFKFYNVVDPYDPNTVIGRILEIARGWKVGYVSPTVAGLYRTFEQYDDYLLSFVYNTVPELYRCLFVFDPYKMEINVYDADSAISILPIYLDFDNLLESVEIDEICDELVTAMRPYGADQLDIRDVNPIGNNWIYNISYFIDNGDISPELAAKWKSWEQRIESNRTYYNALVALRSSSTAQLLAKQSQLVDLNGELTNFKNQQSVEISAIAEAATDELKKYHQDKLAEINGNIERKSAEVSALENDIATLSEKINGDGPESYKTQISTVVNDLSINNIDNFTAEEQDELNKYFIETDLTEETFVATDLETSVSGSTLEFKNLNVRITESAISEVDLTDTYHEILYAITGGKVSIVNASVNPEEEYVISGDVIRGTLECGSDNQYLLSLYMGEFASKDVKVSSGLITLTGSLDDRYDDIQDVDDGGVITREGTSVGIYSTSGSLFMTANVSDYQKYSVQSELLDYARSTLSDNSSPIYEFSVSSGNFLFAEKFESFRNSLRLGSGVYLNLNTGDRITPALIEIEFSFDDETDFSLLFSNRFRRHDSVNTLKDMIENSYSSSRSFEASKYIYDKAVSSASKTSSFIGSALDAAKNAVLAGANHSVVIDGAGIHVGANSNRQIRITDSMIAMTDDNWGSAKTAIGWFVTDDNQYWGLNTEVLSGKIVISENLLIESTSDTGVVQFKVDQTGAWLNNSTLTLQCDSGGKILIDPRYGIMAGTQDLFTTSGTTLTPTFIDDDGNMVTDEDGMPQNTNFYIDTERGDAHFRGTVHAEDGNIGGWILANDMLYSQTVSDDESTYVALNASKTDYPLYAIWTGNTDPSAAPFSVTRDGKLHATEGYFEGTLSAVKLSGNINVDTNIGDSDGWLIGAGMNVGDGKMVIDRDGNLTSSGSAEFDGNLKIYGSIILGGGISWDIDSDSPTLQLFNNDETGALYVNADYINTGDVNADYVRLSCGYGGIGKGIGSVGSTDTYGIMMYATGLDPTTGGYLDPPQKNYISTYSSVGQSCYTAPNGPYFIATNAGCRMTYLGYTQIGDGTYKQVSKSWYVGASGATGDLASSTSSDRRVKSNIATDLDKYERFFMDLKPASYTYNYDETGRTHLGFIAQDVETSIASGGLTIDDFAGICITPKDTIGECHGLTNFYSLRYDEFISLNTYMIQKLYHRIDELERKLNAMTEQEGVL